MEGPAEKRARVLGAGPHRKRDTREAAAQQRAFAKSTRRKKLAPEVQALADQIAEIKKLEEAVGLVDVLKTDRNRPYYEAVDRLRRAEGELAAAREHLEAAGQADVSDLDERQDKLRHAIVRRRADLETMYQKIAIDASWAEPA